ncbi:MAG: DoxX family protein [Deltaproteobacteria bacterium]|nr:DoxX family protein [Nannocystaceae bacterium]
MPGSSRWLDHGLLVLRVGIGGMFMAHGWPKLAGGAPRWAKLGGAMAHLGLDFWPTLWGFSAACAEFFGGMLLALGLLFKPAAAMLLATMVVAAVMHVRSGDGFMGASHAIEAGILFASLLLIGPGRFALAEKLGR